MSEFSSLLSILVKGLKDITPSTNLFLASEALLINLLRTSETFVQSSLASSKSPIINRHVVVHPEPSASLSVFIICVNVLTFVAASPAVLAILAISTACSSEYPSLTNF